MQGFVWVISFKKATNAFCYPAPLTVDGWFHFLSSKGLRKSEVTSILLIEARICLYNLCMYVWSCSFADGYLQQLFRLLQGQTKIICQRTFCLANFITRKNTLVFLNHMFVVPIRGPF